MSVNRANASLLRFSSGVSWGSGLGVGVETVFSEFSVRGSRFSTLGSRLSFRGGVFSRFSLRGVFSRGSRFSRGSLCSRGVFSFLTGRSSRGLRGSRFCLGSLTSLFSVLFTAGAKPVSRTSEFSVSMAVLSASAPTSLCR